MNTDAKPEKQNTPFVEGGIYSKLEQGGTMKVTGTLIASNLPIRNGNPGKRMGRMVMASFVDDQVDEGGKLNQWTLEAVPVRVDLMAEIVTDIHTLKDRVDWCMKRTEALELELASKRPPAPTVEVLERVAREAVAADIETLRLYADHVNAKVDRINGVGPPQPRDSSDDDDVGSEDDGSEEAEEPVAQIVGGGANPLAALEAARARRAG